MIIEKKKLKDVIPGDILIIDRMSKMGNDPRINLSGTEDLEHGESSIFLYEIDDIDIEYDETSRSRMIYTFYHEDYLTPPISFNKSRDYMIDVIKNPWKTLPHYKMK